MRDDERQEYLQRWGNKCYICYAHVEDADRILVDSIVPLERFPKHADGQYIRTYMVCPACKERGDLI